MLLSAFDCKSVSSSIHIFESFVNLNPNRHGILQATNTLLTGFQMSFKLLYHSL